MNFQRNSEGREMVSDLKKIIADFLTYRAHIRPKSRMQKNASIVTFSQKNATYFPEVGAGGSKAIRGFSENSSILAGRGLPKGSNYSSVGPMVHKY